jgi:hypothetical protein
MRLRDFIGTWTLDRRIEDRLTGQDGHFRGTARFDDTGARLQYLERGLLTLGAAPPMQAERRYVWTEGQDGEIEVWFDDGRPFHSIDMSVVAPAASHDCAPDRYDVAYDFSDWPRWRATWTVFGPRKDYSMVSSYTFSQ